MPIDGNNGISPYDTGRCRIAGLATQTAYANFPHYFSFSLDNILSNTTVNIVKLTIIDLKSGQEYFLFPGGRTSVSFTEEGLRFLNLQIEYQNGGMEAFTIPFQVFPSKPMGVGDCNPVNLKIESKIHYQGLGESYATTTWLDYHIYYHYETGSTTSCEPILKKPVIILDGFDPLDVRNFNKLYNYYFQNQSGTKIAEQLHQKGFDVIIVNFPVLGHTGASTGIPIPSIVKKETSPGVFHDVNKDGRDGGADFIERNAMAVVALIQEINDKLTENNSQEKLVVVGPSMGGQIARYALAYIEKATKFKCTQHESQHPAVCKL